MEELERCPGYVFDVEQGSDEWYKLRLGVATASEFASIMTPATRKPSSSVYINTLVAEYFGAVEEEDRYVSRHMQAGIDLESVGAMYAMDYLQDLLVYPAFVYFNNDKLIGCSPDAMTSDLTTGVEIKTISPDKQVAQLIEQSLPREHLSQVYGSLWVTGAERWLYVTTSRCGTLPPCFVMTEAEGNEDYQQWAEAFEPIMLNFLAKKNSIIGSISDMITECEV